MTTDEIDKEINKLSPDEIDALLASSYADKRCKVEIALAGAALFLALVLCIAHISFYIGDFHPPKFHRAFLLAMAGIVAPYAMVKFYKDVYASAVVRASRRIFIHGKSVGHGA